MFTNKISDLYRACKHKTGGDHGIIFLSIFNIFEDIFDWNIEVIHCFHDGIVLSQIIRSDVCVGGIYMGKTFVDFANWIG